MIRPLDDLVLLREIDEIEGLDYNSAKLRKDYPNEIVVIRRVAFIKKAVLCDKAREKATDLSAYIQLGQFVEAVNIDKRRVLERIYYMEEFKVEIFNYIKVCNMWFLKIEDDVKELFLTHTPFLVTFHQKEKVVDLKLIGDIKVGFY